MIPGFIDMHSHFFREYRGIIPPNAFEMAVALAYGVTTNLDNSQWSQDIFPAMQMIEAGVLVGPRTYTTGDPLYRGDAARQNELTSYEVTEDNIARLQSWGAVSLKQYMQPRRDQRQWVSDVARKRGLMVTAEGSDLGYNLGMIMDGQTAWEHPISYVPMYSDAARFFGRAETVYSPTFVVGGPGPWNDEWFFQETEVWRDPKLRLWMPWKQLVPHSRRVFKRPRTDYSFPMLAQVLADWMAEGAHGAIGAHGQQHGSGVALGGVDSGRGDGTDGRSGARQQRGGLLPRCRGRRGIPGRRQVGRPDDSQLEPARQHPQFDGHHARHEGRDPLRRNDS